MKAKFLLMGTTVALTGWFALAPVAANANPASSYELAQNEWYQGQRGEWHQHHHKWEWRPAEGDEWYQGVQGHWYLERDNKWRWMPAPHPSHRHHHHE